MKKMLILAMTMAMVLLAAAGVCETLRVGMECNYAPYNWTQSDASENAVAIAAGGYADGYDVRIAKIIADQLGMELEIVKTEWDGLTPALLSGNIDVIIAGMSPTAERRMTIDFTDSYYDSGADRRGSQGQRVCRREEPGRPGGREDHRPDEHVPL